MDPTQETAKTDEAAATAPAASPFVDFVANNHRGVCTFCMLLGAACIGASVLRSLTEAFPDAKGRVYYFSIGLALPLLAAGLAPFLFPPERGSERRYARGLILVVGAGVGAIVALGSLVYTATWWSDVVSWLSQTSEGKNLGHMVIICLLLLGGLALMFLSLQVARTEERASPSFRRMVYGSNAAVPAWLILLIVIFLTVFVSQAVKAPLDFTASGDYTLSSRSVNILRNLKTPVEITVITGFEDGLTEEEVKTLLANVQQYTDKIEVKELSVMRNQSQARALAKQFPGIEPGSMLLTYTPAGSDKADHRIIPERDLTAPPEGMMGGPQQHKFTGEDALMTVLAAMAEDKELPVIYFTQGHNELDPAEANPRVPTGCGVFKRRLEEKKTFEVKTLTFDPVKPTVPEKAALVVIAGPRQPFAANEAAALREYMSRKDNPGKMVILLDTVIGRDNKMAPTGLEEFLAGYGIQAPAERIITLPVQFPLQPTEVLAVMNPKFAQQNPLAQLFRDTGFQIEDCRPLLVQPDRPGGSPVQAQPLLMTVSFSYPDTDFAKDPSDIIKDLARNEAEIQKKIRARRPLTIGVAVIDTGIDPHAGMPGAPPPPSTGAKPRMFVVGNASMANNQNMDERSGRLYFDLLGSTIEWLRDRPQNIGIEPKKRSAFVLMPKSDADWYRMAYLPPVLVIGCVLGLATGIWVVRRR